MVDQDMTWVSVIIEAYVHGFFLPFSSPHKNQKSNALYEKVKLDHKQVMMELNNVEKENTETYDNFKELRKETLFYR